jgi:hypothetical protein
MMRGREAFEQAFERLFEAALARFQVECTPKEREEAKLNFSKRFAVQLEALDKYLELDRFPEEIISQIEENIAGLSPVELAERVALAPLVEQMQAAFHAIAAKQAKERLLEHALSQADEQYGGH